MSYFTCPHCNNQIQAIAADGLTYSPETGFKTFASDTPWRSGSLPLPPNPGEYERRIPFRAPSIQHDILPSLAAAGVTGLFGVACSLTASALTDWPFWVALPVGLVGGSLAWLVTQQQHQGTLYQFERFTTFEPQTPQSAPLQTHQSTITVRVKEAGGWHYRELPGEPKALQSLAHRAGLGDSFSERTATGAGLTQDQFRELTDIFVSRGWAEWRNPQRKQQGVELGRNGRAVLRAIAAAPLPDEGEEG
jgi:hypothetical protein